MSRADSSVQISVPWRQGRRQEEEVSLGEQGEEQEPQGQEEQEQGQGGAEEQEQECTQG